MAGEGRREWRHSCLLHSSSGGHRYRSPLDFVAVDGQRTASRRVRFFGLREEVSHRQISDVHLAFGLQCIDDRAPVIAEQGCLELT